MIVINIKNIDIHRTIDFIIDLIIIGSKFWVSAAGAALNGEPATEAGLPGTENAD